MASHPWQGRSSSAIRPPMPHVGGRHSRLALCNDLTAVVESVLMAVRDAALALRPPEQLPDHDWPLATRVDPDTGMSNARATLSSDPTARGRT